MRLFEILLLLINALYLALKGRAGPRQPRLAAYLPFAALAVMLLSLLLEKPRWQMIPLYVFTLVFLAVEIAHFSNGRAALNGLQRPGWQALTWFLLVLAAILPILLPVPVLPKPSGPYPVGSTTFYWIDESRDEIYSPQAGDKRRLMVQVWYPAASQKGARRSPYLQDLSLLLPALAPQLGLPPVLLSHLQLARTHSVMNAPAVDGSQTFPVLVFSHGWTGLRAQNTYQMEELASHGYILFSADHTYGASGVVFPGGEVVPNQPEALPRDLPDEAYDQAARLLGQSWVGDIRFVLDQAERLNTGDLPSPLTQRLDLERVGILGHSTGGGAVVETCWVDARCKAGLSMDAWLVPYDRAIPTEGLPQPFMMMQSEHWLARRNPPLVDTLFTHLQSDAYRVILQGAYHDSFTDVPLFTPLISRIRTGRLFSRYTDQDIINAYSLAFFDKYLKGESAPLLQAPPPFSGVQFQRQNQ